MSLDKFVLSIDVAIKHLAFCLFKNSNIESWQLINLIKDDFIDSICPISCSGVTVKKIKCNKPAKFKHIENNNIYCKVHSNKFKDKIQPIKDIFKCSIDTCNNDIQFYYKSNQSIIGFCNKHKKNTTNTLERYYTVSNCNDFELRCLLFKKLDTFDFSFVNKVLIERQPKHATEKMKSISYAIFDYFIIKTNYKCKPIWIDPKNKLTVYNGPVIKCDLTDPYERNKWFACKYCSWYLENRKDDVNLKLFNSFKKQDDLADCYLQGIYYIENKGVKKQMTQQQQQVYTEQNIIKYKKIKSRKPKAGKIKYSLGELKYLVEQSKKSGVANNTTAYKNSCKFFFGDENYIFNF